MGMLSVRLPMYRHGCTFVVGVVVVGLLYLGDG